MKKILTICFILIVSTCYAQRDYHKGRTRYFPRSHQGGPLLWLELGPSSVFANVIDKSTTSAKAMPAYGFGMRSKQLLNRTIFTYVNVSLLSTESKDIRFEIDGHDKLSERYDFVNITAGISFYMFGNDKTKFAFSPLSFGIGIMSYNYNYDFSKPSIEDGNILGTNFGLTSVTSIHLRLSKFYFFVEGEFFSSLSNGTVFHFIDTGSGFVGDFENNFKPSWYAAMIHVGIRYNL